ncbi:rhotekin [Rhinolophus ferrumequinum]|uniref:Rhotekin n=1 Tax=Rhinolophus ferrumequinum TaxID=59479 RepID=A0A7J7V905_RHIFE|nr:rhotekin [Rhinolophus ferrumequinum]
MFSRNDRSRVTVARGSALEMEFKRGRFRLSLFSDQPELGEQLPPKQDWTLCAQSPFCSWPPFPGPHLPSPRFPLLPCLALPRALEQW